MVSPCHRLRRPNRLAERGAKPGGRGEGEEERQVHVHVTSVHGLLLLEAETLFFKLAKQITAVPS